MDPAQRRFQNDQERNRALVTGGPGKNAARSSMRPTADNRINQLARPNKEPNSNPVMSQVTGTQAGPQRPQEGLGPPPQTFDDQTANLQRQVRMEKLMTSPEAQNANTIVSLRNFWNGRHPDYQRGRQVAGILETYAPPD